jgi:hypothetical protein
VASLIAVFFFTFLFFFFIMSVSQRRGFKWRRVSGWSTGHATIVKDEAAKTHITVPLLHGRLFIEASYSLFKWLNFWAFFTLGSNGGTRGL